ncbi:hypothetical protein GRJ2_001413600 [Grus japonensis]|uniref:Uncharacterized protein n=1 Tax=Grus japonensis TaxID=30415 RepID=A0ABC9WVJ8_GRUJA
MITALIGQREPGPASSPAPPQVRGDSPEATRSPRRGGVLQYPPPPPGGDIAGDTGRGPAERDGVTGPENGAFYCPPSLCETYTSVSLTPQSPSCCVFAASPRVTVGRRGAGCWARCFRLREPPSLRCLCSGCSPGLCCVPGTRAARAQDGWRLGSRVSGEPADVTAAPPRLPPCTGERRGAAVVPQTWAARVLQQNNPRDGPALDDPGSRCAAVGAEAASGTRTSSCSPVGEAGLAREEQRRPSRCCRSLGGVGGTGDAARLCRHVGKAHPDARARSTAPRQRAPRDAVGRMCPVRDGQMDGWTEEPQPCREPRGVRSPGKKPGCLRRGRRCRLPCTGPRPAWGQPCLRPPGDAAGLRGSSLRSSSWMAPGQFMAPAHLQLQPMDGSGWFQLQLVVVPASLQLQVRLLDSSSSVLAPAHLRFPSQAQLICSSFAASGPARLLSSSIWCLSSSPTDSQFRGVCGSSSSPVELVLVPAILAFGQAVNQSLSPLAYEYDLS